MGEGYDVSVGFLGVCEGEGKFYFQTINAIKYMLMNSDILNQRSIFLFDTL
jgi:hypothetical protein